MDLASTHRRCVKMVAVACCGVVVSLVGAPPAKAAAYAAPATAVRAMVAAAPDEVFPLEDAFTGWVARADEADPPEYSIPARAARAYEAYLLEDAAPGWGARPDEAYLLEDVCRQAGSSLR